MARCKERPVILPGIPNKFSANKKNVKVGISREEICVYCMKSELICNFVANNAYTTENPQKLYFFFLLPR